MDDKKISISRESRALGAEYCVARIDGICTYKN
jgi:hypothetical protein